MLPEIAERAAREVIQKLVTCGLCAGCGNESGETSWLARRLRLLPEGGRERATPWIHSDVLELIARDGLGVSPREVEVD